MNREQLPEDIWSSILLAKLENRVGQTAREIRFIHEEIVGREHEHCPGRRL